MYQVEFRLSWNENTAPQDIQRTVYALVEALAIQNTFFLLYNPRTPPLYSSGVVYRPEKGRKDQFFDIGEVLRQGHADCEDLAAWRIAEHRIHRVNAIPDVIYYPDPKSQDIPWMFHIRVRLPNGLIEDPSIALGMK